MPRGKRGGYGENDTRIANNNGKDRGMKSNPNRGGKKSRNELIDEIRKKNNSVDFADVTGKMRELATDQNGSR